MTAPIIQAIHLTKTYAGSAHPSLDDVSLTVGRGEFVFLSGPSGAGKSTLLRLIFAAERATSGQILVEGRNIVQFGRSQVAELRRRVGVVFQDFKLVQTESVYENVEYPLQVSGVPEKEIRKRVYRVLKGVGLLDKASELPPRLSGGEQQRISIARALVNEPMLLLADEPTGNLDEETTRDIMLLFEEANKRGTTVLFATHDRWLIENYGQRLIYLKNGTIQDAGMPPQRPAFGR